MSAGDVVLISMRGTVTPGNVKIANTFHYAMLVGSGVPDMPSMVANFEAVIGTLIMAALCNGYKCDSIEGVVISGPSTGLQAFGTAIPGNNATGGGTQEDNAYCLVMQRKTGFAGRKGMGRIFFSPVPDTVFDTSGKVLVLPAAFTAISAAYTTNLLDALGQGYQPVLFEKVGPGQTPVIQTAYSNRAGIRKHRRYKP